MSKHDTLDAIWTTARIFRQLNMGPPAITLASHDDGMRLLSEVADTYQRRDRPVEAYAAVTRPRSAAGKWKPDAEPGPETVEVRRLELPHQGKLIYPDSAVPLMEIRWMGVKVRWPAKRMALPNGQHLWY